MIKWILTIIAIYYILKFLFLIISGYIEYEEYQNLPPRPVEWIDGQSYCPKCNEIVDKSTDKLFCQKCGRNIAWEVQNNEN